jgi:hypothetical protein
MRMNRINGPFNPRVGGLPPRTDVGAAKEDVPSGPQAPGAAPAGLPRQNAIRRPTGPMAPRVNHLPGARVQAGDAGGRPAATPVFVQGGPARPAGRPPAMHPGPQIRPRPLPHLPPKLAQALASILQSLLDKHSLQSLLQQLQRPAPQGMQPGKPAAAAAATPAPAPAPAPAKALPLAFAPLYQGLNLKVTPDTLPTFTNANLVGKPAKLGSGAFNTVYAVQLEKPGGGMLNGVFKPLGNEERGWVAAATGIPSDNPQIAMRNIATLAYAQKLGIDVIPDTRVAVLATDLDGPKLGLVMERATGKPAAETDAAVFDRADVRAEMTKLQLLDHLTGQGDRHGQNFFIDTAANGRAKVTGIDNDQCFGARLTDPNGIRYGKGRAQYGFRGTSLPPVVDSEMAAKIKSLTHDDIRAMLGDKLSGPEVGAAIARHEGVKRHIAKLEAENLVIRPEDWNKPHVTELLNARNSYVGRERENAQVRARLQGPTGQRPNADWA